MKGKEFWSGVRDRTYKREESRTRKVRRTKKGNTAPEPALASFGVFFHMEDPTDEVLSADVDEIKEKETYPKEEPREEYEPTPDEQKNESYDNPGESDGCRGQELEERDDEGGGEVRVKEEDPPDDEEGPERPVETTHTLRRVAKRRALNEAVRGWQEEVDEETERQMSEIPEISQKELEIAERAENLRANKG